MSFTDFINRMCKQTVVYWGSPTIDGFSKKTFASPVERQVRYEDVEQLDRLDRGEEKLVMARMWVTEEFDEGGYIYLGTLDDLDSNPANPLEVEGASLITSVRRIPNIGSSTEYIRRVSVQLKTTETI